MIGVVLRLGIRFFLSHRWTFYALAGLFIVLGASSFITAHPAKPVAMQGTIASFSEYTRNNAYDHSEIVLNENASQTYTLDKTNFHPDLPDFDHIYKNGKVTLWLNAGTTDVIALELYDQDNQHPVRYTSAYYDTPGQAMHDNLVTGSILSVISLAFLLMGLFWWKMPWTKSARLYAPVILPTHQKS